MNDPTEIVNYEMRGGAARLRTGRATTTPI